MSEHHPGDQLPGDPHRVTRTVVVPAATDEVWHAVADPERRATWLDDPDAAARTVRVERAEEGRRLVWTWWRSDGDDPDASTVEIALRPADGGGTRVVVTETPLVAAPRAQASAAVGVAGAAGPVRGQRWDARLLGLELLYVAVLAAVL